MPSKAAFVLALLAGSAWAAPGKPCKKAVCNADNCLRAVRATSASPFAQSATADCSSFMRKTVTPCASTTTTTTTVTVTGAPSLVTVANVVPVTQVNTVIDTITSVVTTVEDTVTFIQPTEVDVINIIVTAVTVTAVPFKKRVVTSAPPTIGSPSTCAASTNAPTAVPTYASACSGTARYSSACMCAGITGATVTAAAPTSTATSTSTVTVTPTLTVPVTVPTTVPVTVVATEVVPVVFETTDATVIVQSAFTIVSNIVIPTTVVVGFA